MDDKNQKPLITTIIPTYRRPKLLRRAIKSVLNQTYPHFQVCVYDNASGDETAEVVAEFAKKDLRIKYHCHLENIGAVNNFAYGIDHVDTPLFSFLSDDDFLLPNFYALGAKKLDAYPKASFFAGATIHLSPEGRPLRVSLKGWREGLYDPPIGLLAMLKKGHPTWTGILFRRDCVEAYTRAKENVLADLDFELNLAMQKTFYVTTLPVAVLTVHQSRISTNHTWTDIRRGIEKITNDLGKGYAADSEMCKDICTSWNRIAVRMILGEAIQRLITAEPAEAVELTAYCIHDRGYVPKICKWAHLLGRIGVRNESLATLAGRTLGGIRWVFEKTRIHRNIRYLEQYGIRLPKALPGLVDRER